MMNIGNYKFEIKNFKYLESRSEETYCFSAVLCVNGNRVAKCGNSGQGGSTDVYFFPSNKELRNEILDFLKTQPKVTFEGYDFEMDLTLDYIIDQMVDEQVNALHFKKLKKQMGKCLVFQRRQGGYYSLKWKNVTVDELLKNPKGHELLKKAIAKETAKGNILVNNNIPPELLPQ